MLWRVLAGGAAAVAGLWWLAAPAAAELTDNTARCSGSATITDPDGETYEANADDVSVEVPREGVAQWEGSIGVVTHNHVGKVELALGPTNKVPLGDWGPSENADDEDRSSGVEEIPDELQYVPPGEYVVSGFHRGDEGGCAGSVVVVVDASPFSTLTGIGVLALTVLSGAGLVWSAAVKVPKP